MYLGLSVLPCDHELWKSRMSTALSRLPSAAWTSKFFTISSSLGKRDRDLTITHSRVSRFILYDERSVLHVLQSTSTSYREALNSVTSRGSLERLPSAYFFPDYRKFPTDSRDQYTEAIRSTIEFPLSVACMRLVPIMLTYTVFMQDWTKSFPFRMWKHYCVLRSCAPTYVMGICWITLQTGSSSQALSLADWNRRANWALFCLCHVTAEHVGCPSDKWVVLAKCLTTCRRCAKYAMIVWIILCLGLGDVAFSKRKLVRESIVKHLVWNSLVGSSFRVGH